MAQATAQDSGDGPPPAAEGKQPPANDDKPKVQAAATPAPLLLKPGQELPKGKWVDALQSIDLQWDAVSGEWRRQGTDLAVAHSNFQRIMLPVELKGSYELKVDFTRFAGAYPILIVFPVGKRTCALDLAERWETVHGLSLIDGRNAYDRNNPAVWTPGKLVNSQRYPVLISVQIEGDMAKIDVSLDKHPIISWSGRQESLDVEPWWSLPKPYRPALACNDTDVVYHSALVRAMDGKARMAPPHISPTIDLNDRRWVDLLANVDLDHDVIQGWWLKAGNGTEVAPASQDEGFVRLMFQRPVEGSYDLLAEFTRTRGSDAVTFHPPRGHAAVHVAHQRPGWAQRRP